jgi:hypothetical protein
MTKRPHRIIRHALPAIVAIVAGLASPARANSFGIIGRSGKQGLSCSQCHFGGVLPAVRLDGPLVVAPGETATYHFEVQSMIPSQRAGGLDIAASDGQLGTIAGQNEQVIGGELTHTRPNPNDDNGLAGWNFTWKAPDAIGTYTLFGAGNSVNLNNQDSGDRSNTTTIDIEVAESTATPTVTPIPATRTARPTTGPLPCVGDCDGNGSVAIGELITGVNISLGSRPLTDCADFDANDSGAIEVNELVSAVNGALLGCVP